MISVANKASEERLLEIKESKDKIEAELNDKIRNFEKELENANELLSDSKLRGDSFLFASCHKPMNVISYPIIRWYR